MRYLICTTCMLTTALALPAQEVVVIDKDKPFTEVVDQIEEARSRSDAVVVRSNDQDSGTEGDDEAEPSEEDLQKKKEEEAKKIQQQFLRAVGRLRYRRNAGEVVGALAESLDDTGEAEEIPENENDNQRYQRLGQKQAEIFDNAVMRGDWQLVHEMLEPLDKGQQKNIYNRMLGGLGHQESVLFPADALGVAEAWPQDYDNELMQRLGQLVNKAVQHSGNSSSLVALLKQGTPHFGGEDQANRGRAVSLLLAADLIKDAGSFLPPLEEARASNDPELLDVHASYLSAIGNEQNKKPLLQGWELTIEVLAHEDSDQTIINNAVSRALQLLMQVSEADGNEWLHASFSNRSAQGMRALAHICERLQQGFKANQLPPRVEALQLQHRVVNSLLTNFEADMKLWKTPVNIIAMSWLQEANYSINKDQQNNNNNRNPSRYYNRNRNNKEPIEAAQLLKYGPTSLWYPHLDIGIAQSIQSLNGSLMCKAGDIDGAIEVIRALAKNDIQEAQELAKNVLLVWAQQHRPERGNNYNQYNPFNRYGGGMYMGSYYNRYNRNNQQGIPLTRAKQNKYLEELSSLLQQLYAVHLPKLDSAAIIAAFDACHSQAEVYFRKDIEAVFGSFESLDKMTMLQLVNNMRNNLGQRWRQPKVQKTNKTRRSNKELIAEVKRGYQLAGEIIDEVQKRDQHFWQAQVMQAQLIFDHAEFLYGQEENLQVYTAQRDKSLQLFKQATEVYLKHMTLENRTIDPYLSWFNALLGASDLSVLTRQQDPEEQQLLALREHMLSLTPKQSEWHLNAFGEGITRAMSEVKGELKPRFLESALIVLGDHKSGDKARELLAYYDDLLKEIKLHTAIDGDTRVGTDTFGLHLSIRHTDAIAREAGGFGKYLSNQVHISYNEAPVDYRDDFEKHIRTALGERFDVTEISFHEPTVQQIGFGRDRWRETPMAYVILKAKDESVDRVPAIKLDMDFLDGHGTVILPISSGEELIDATRASDRPFRNLAVEVVLDDRKSDEGDIQLEIRASGKGILPPLSMMLSPLDGSWKESDRYSEDMLIERLELDDHGSAPIANRHWRLTYQATDKIDAFTFPTLLLDGKLETKRYVDADIEEAESTVALLIEPAETSYTLWYIIAGVAAALLILWRVLKRTPQETTAQRYQLPQQVTVFSVCALLRALQRDSQLQLSDSERQQIAEAVDELENAHFAPEANGLSEDELKRRAEQWLAKVA